MQQGDGPPGPHQGHGRITEQTTPTRSTPTQRIVAKDGTPYEVTEEGSLSLLALGYRGLIAGRAKRAEEEQQRHNLGTGPDETA